MFQMNEISQQIKKVQILKRAEAKPSHGHRRALKYLEDNGRLVTLPERGHWPKRIICKETGPNIVYISYI